MQSLTYTHTHVSAETKNVRVCVILLFESTIVFGHVYNSVLVSFVCVHVVCMCAYVTKCCMLW